MPRRSSLAFLPVLLAATLHSAQAQQDSVATPGVEVPTVVSPPAEAPTQTAPSKEDSIVAPLQGPVDAPTAAPFADQSTLNAPPATAPATEATLNNAEAAPTSGRETSGSNFSLQSPQGVIYDMARGLALARGEVVFTYGDFRVRGTQGVVDYNNNTATMSGDLTVTARLPNGNLRTFNGQSLVFNLETGAWTLSQLQATFPPEYFPRGTVLSPIYLRNGTVTGDYDTASGSDFRFSSCDRDHYFIESKKLDFYRDQSGEPDRIVLKRNAIYVLGQRILPLPVFVISLKGQRSRRIGLQPTVGQNSYDGFFAKTVVDLAATSHRTDSLLVDLLQKRGLGLGLQRELAGGAGVLYLYALSGQNGGRQIDTRVRRSLQLARNLTSFLSYESTKNNSISGAGYSTQSGQLNFNFNNGSRVQSSLLLSQNASGGIGSSFSQQNATFTHQQDFGGGWNLGVNTLYARSTSTGSDDNATLDNEFELGRTSKYFDARLRTELHDDLTGLTQRNGAYQLERIPELTLSTDTTRLGLPFLERALPGELSIAMGQFNEPSSLQRLSRTDFNYNARSRDLLRARLGPLRSQLNVGGAFEQAIYSNDTARYNYTTNLNWNTAIGSTREGNAVFDVQVNYLKFATYGYTPFQFDYQTPNEFIDARAIFQPSRKFRLEVAGGRDLENNISRDITGVLRFDPSRSVNLDLSTSYSTEGGGLRDVIGNIYLSRSRRKFGGGSIVLGLRYSPTEKTFTTINTAADLQFGRRTRLQAFAGYSGISKKLEFGQFRVVRDLHCFNLYATYDTQRSQFRIDLALKAFPFLDSRLGQSQFGEGFDARVGAVR